MRIGNLVRLFMSVAILMALTVFNSEVCLSDAIPVSPPGVSAVDQPGNPPEISPSPTATPSVNIYCKKEGNKIVVYAQNFSPSVIHYTFKFSKIKNVKMSVDSPYHFVIPPTPQMLLFTVEPLSSDFSANYTCHGDVGDPDAVTDESYLYVLPWEHGKKHRLDQGYLGKATHASCYCLDFDLGEGTPVCATRDGVVVRVSDDSNVSGMPKTGWHESNPNANDIIIYHSDGTMSMYAHLQYKSARVKVGTHVSAGQVIALSGSTGADGPHLHFVVYKASWDRGNDENSIPTKFMSENNRAITLEEGMYYYSFHSDGAPSKIEP